MAALVAAPIGWTCFLLLLAFFADANGVFDTLASPADEYGVLALFLSAVWAWALGGVLWILASYVNNDCRWTLSMCRWVVYVHLFVGLVLGVFGVLWLGRGLFVGTHESSAVALYLAPIVVSVMMVRSSLRAYGFLSRVMVDGTEGTGSGPCGGTTSIVPARGLSRREVWRSIAAAGFILIAVLVLAGGEIEMGKFRGLNVRGIKEIRVYEEDRTTLLLRTSDPAQMAKFADALKDARTYRPYRPEHLASCFIIVDGISPIAFRASRLGDRRIQLPSATLDVAKW